MTPLNIPPGFKEWEGSDNLSLGLPWLPVKCIEWLDQMAWGAEVVEIGAGGSTIFFLQRADELTSIEVNHSMDWYKAVQGRAEGLDQRKAEFLFIHNSAGALTKRIIQYRLQAALERTVSPIVLIDPISPVNRTDILVQAVNETDVEAIFVCDNFADSLVWPELAWYPPDKWPFVLSAPHLSTHVFPGQNWIGGGTLVLYPTGLPNAPV